VTNDNETPESVEDSKSIRDETPVVTIPEDAAASTHSTSDDADVTEDAVEEKLKLAVVLKGRGLKWTALAVVLALAVAAGVLGLMNHRDSSVDDGAQAAERTVSDSLVKLFSYTPETVSSDLDSELPLLTGKMRDDYKILVTSSLAPTAVKNKVTAKATIQAIGIENAAKDKVVILAFVNVSVTTSASKSPKVGGSRVRVTVERSGDTWRISAMDPI
jgi:Mce-associated membrane protein